MTTLTCGCAYEGTERVLTCDRCAAEHALPPRYICDFSATNNERVVFKGQPWRCECPGRRRYNRHTMPIQCMPPEAVDEWRKAHPEATCSDKIARELTFMEREWGGKLRTL